MKRYLQKSLALLLALALLCAAVPARADDPAPVAVTGVALDKTTLSLVTGATAQLTAIIAPADATDKAVTWTSGDETVATVSSSGLVTAVAPGGPVTITVATTDGDFTATCTVTVYAPAAVEGLTLSGVSTDGTLFLDPSTAESSVTATVSALVAYPDGTPDAARTATVSWSLSGSCVTLSAATGPTVTLTAGTAPGRATLTATAGGRTASCVVEVSGLTLSLVNTEASPLELYPGQTSSVSVTSYGWATLSYISSYSWSSASAPIAGVTSAGGGANSVTATITGVAAADDPVAITASCTYGVHPSYTASCYVKVLPIELRKNLNSAGRLAFSDLKGSTSESNTLLYINKLVSGSDGVNYLASLNVPTGQGTLYYGYVSESDPGEGVSSAQRYYASAASGSRLYENITFVPKPDFTGTATITFTCCAANGKTYTGRVYVTVGPTDASLTYTSENAAPVQFRASDFTAYAQALGHHSIRYVKFTLPSASQGTLWYNYTDADVNEGRVGADTLYYRTSSPYLDKVWFVPTSGAKQVDVRFNGVDTAGASFDGVVHIDVTGVVGESRADAVNLQYSVPSGGSVYFDPADFALACEGALGETLNYIYFSSVSSARGTLYCGGTAVTSGSGSRYYRAASGSRRTIGELYFRASSGAGATTFSYTGVGAGGESFTGTVRVTVTDSGSDVYYTVAAGQKLGFDAADFSSASYAVRGVQLNYITFTALPAAARGKLYWDEDTAVTTGTSYYRAATASRRLISDLSFVPAGGFTSGTVTIPYTGYGTSGRSFTGSVVITVTSAAAAAGGAVTDVGGMITYASDGRAVAFRSRDFVADAARSLSYGLSSVRFYTPDAAQGRLCLNYVSPTSYTVLDATADYAPASLDRVSFQPRAGLEGPAYIRFVGTDTSGKSYTGTLAVNVTPPTASSYFDDMGSHRWAIPDADFLAAYGIVGGTGYRAFSPAGRTKRGDFALMLVRCFGFSAASGESPFDDVPVNSYYAAAIGALYAAGITVGDGDGNYRPQDTLTRQEAAVFLYRCMKRTGSLTDGTAADLTAFSDRAAIAPYAQTAVATLARLGVLEGSGGWLYPAAPLTRAEMAALFHKALT